MLHASPDVDVDVDLQQGRISVDLQESTSVHFESASFDLLKDKIMFPENDSLDADPYMEMARAPAMKVLEDKDQRNNIVTRIPEAEAGAESENELDCLGMLEERLRDMNIMEGDFWQNKDGDRDNIISTPLEQFSNCNVASQYFILLYSIFIAQTKSTIAALQAPVRQFVRPKNKAQVPAAPTAKCNNAPPAPLLTRRNSMRPSISSALPVPAPASTAAQATKKTMMARGIPARRPIGSTVYSAQPQPPRPRGSVSTMTLNGVQRPPAPALANVAHSRAMSVSSSAVSVRTQSQSQSQRNKQMTTQVAPSSFKVTAVAGASTSGLRRPSSVRAPTSRVGASGIAVPRASSGGVSASGARRMSMSTPKAVDGGGNGGGRLGLIGANKMGPVKGDVQGRSASARMMRRV
jgi:hypothetical protein